MSTEYHSPPSVTCGFKRSTFDIGYMSVRVVNNDCYRLLDDGSVPEVDLTFLDAPYLENADSMPNTTMFDKNMDLDEYWSWIADLCRTIYDTTSDGGVLYFMQTGHNVSEIVDVVRRSEWNLRNLIIWRGGVPVKETKNRFPNKYHAIAFATKGDEPRVFNELSYTPEVWSSKYDGSSARPVSDVWVDIMELNCHNDTIDWDSVVGDEPLTDETGERIHMGQTPIELMVRIILSSTDPGDLVFDPFAGTGTTGVVSKQLNRRALLIEQDEQLVKTIKERIDRIRDADDVSSIRSKYAETDDISEIWC